MRLFGLLACLVFSCFVRGQVTPRNLLQKNFTPAGLAQVILPPGEWKPFPTSPEEWKKILPDSIIRQYIHGGEMCLKADFPNIPATVAMDFLRNGNRTRYENISFGKRVRLRALFMAESMEGKGRFLDAIVNGIWSISEESFWGVSAHLFLQKAGNGLPDVEEPVVDLFAAETAADLAWADYFVGRQLDSISPLIRRRIYSETNRRIFIPLQTAKYDWMGAGNPQVKLNNWDPWIMSNYLAAALLLEKNDERRLSYTWKAMQLTDQYINGLGEDGACEEGPTYWMYGPGSVLNVLDLLKSVSQGRIDIFHQPVIRNMAAYIYKTHIGGDYFVNVADAHPETTLDPVMIRRFGGQTGDAVMVHFGDWLYRRAADGNSLIRQVFHFTTELFDLAALHGMTGRGSEDAGRNEAARRGRTEGNGRNEAAFHDIDDAWLPDVQLMVSRMAGGLFVAAHAGNNGESHNHNDIGDLIVYKDGEPVIIDVGSGTYTSRTFSKDRYLLWFNTSAYHNLPVINGQEQPEGASYAAGNVVYQKNADGVIFRMNLEKAYPASAGINSWVRNIRAEKKGVITLTDSVRMEKPLRSLTQTFMTVCAADIGMPGKIVFTTEHGKTVTLQYDAKLFTVSKEPITLTTPEEAGLKDSWHGKVITRILLSLRGGVNRRIFKFQLI
jgi:hypothetical protein